MTRRVLFLMRHADAELVAGGGDLRRALSAHGVQQAQEAGRFLATQQPPVRLALRSHATRTEETLAQLHLSAPVEIEPALYHAGGGTICGVLTGVGDDVTSVLVLGHAPGIPAAVHLLADRTRSDAAALRLVDAGYGTATIARLEFDGDWTDLADAERRAALVAVYRP